MKGSGGAGWFRSSSGQSLRRSALKPLQQKKLPAESKAPHLPPPSSNSEKNPDLDKRKTHPTAKHWRFPICTLVNLILDLSFWPCLITGQCRRLIRFPCFLVHRNRKRKRNPGRSTFEGSVLGGITENFGVVESIVHSSARSVCSRIHVHSKLLNSFSVRNEKADEQLAPALSSRRT